MQIKAKMSTFDLTGEINRGRSYILTEINYGMFRIYFDVNVYDPFNGSGEQRIARQRHVDNLRNSISNETYTPTVFNACINSLEQIDIDDNNKVAITLDENDKLAILDGGSRLRALEDLRSACDTKLQRRVDNLPIPLIVYLQPEKRKDDFIHLNQGLPVNRSQIQLMKLDGGQVVKEKLEAFELARDIISLLHQEDNSPLQGKVNFGQDSNGTLAFKSLISDRAGDIITTAFGSARMLLKLEQSSQWFVDRLVWMNDFIRNNTDCAQAGKLLALPPDGPKGAVHNLIGVTNVWNYYVYLLDSVSEQIPDYSILIEALRFYDLPAAGDLSSSRKKSLICAFTQSLFASLAEDDDIVIGFHFGIPIPLFNITGGGSTFGVENPPNIKSKRSNKTSEMIVNEIEMASMPSDTDPAWEG